MSESNAPYNNPNAPKDEASLAWRDPFTGMYEAEDSDMSALFNSLAAEEMLNPTPSDVTETEPYPDSQPPELADLVSLIQELNQCNSALLDRVSQLEEALEQSHGSLTLVEPPAAPMPEDLPKAREQLTTLHNQLEFAHQTNQRQQILLETLTAQLESSQERVAQLERETSSVQQRYTDQSQSLAQSESNCRDLQARLHRQQRYTLQFKAALEKCLELPTPQYEGQEAPAATAGDYLFLPKAQRIKPWAAQSDALPGKMPWMNLTTEALEHFEADHQASLANDRLNLPTFTLPDLQPAQVEETPTVEAVAELPIEGLEENMTVQTTIFHETVEPLAANDLADSAIADSAIDEALLDQFNMDHISAVVQPLADLIAEAMLAEPFHVDALQPSPVEPSAEIVPLPFSQSSTPEPAIEFPSPEPVAASIASEPIQPILPIPMADAEDALWQDLARLIDVSTEDVVKASLSGDFAAFEAIDFAALENKVSEPSVETDPWEGALANPLGTRIASESMPMPQPEAPVAQPVPQPIEAPVAQQPPVTQPVQKQPARKPSIQSPLNAPAPSLVPAFVATSQNSPSPLVYPLRPAKKRQSLAMVELPDFRRPQSANPMPT
jgi:hypothetical protein